ncbi:MAG: porin family protein [Marinomonas sp.]
MTKKLVSLFLLVNVYALPSYATEKFNFDLIVGSANQKTNVAGEDAKKGDSDSVGGRLSYLLNDNFAIDLSYFDYGNSIYKTSRVSTRTKSSAKSIGFSTHFDLNEKLLLKARSGISFWEFDAVEAFTTSTNIWTFSDDGMDPYYGLGLEYTLDDKVTLGLDLSYIKMGIEPSNLTADHEVINTSLSLGYRF